jgi:hypothetical protein
MPLKRFSEKELQMFFRKIFYAIITIVQFFKNMFEYKDYYIKKADFLYIRDGIKQLDNITREYREGGPKKIIDEMTPDIIDFLFRIRYIFKNKEYLYLTRNPNHCFPPVKKGMSFSLPIKEAILLDSSGVQKYDVTEHVKMYAGPAGDFHGETILIRDIEIEFPTIQLRNIMDTVVEYDVKTGEINHRTLWLPSKT